MALPICLIPIPEARLMHLAVGEVSGLMRRAGKNALKSAEALASIRTGKIGGQVLPPLMLIGNGWAAQLQRNEFCWVRSASSAAPGFDLAQAEDLLCWSLLGRWPTDPAESEPKAFYFWANEVCSVAAGLRGLLVPETEAFNCLHGPTTGREQPGTVTSQTHINSGSTVEPLRLEWDVAGVELYDLDRPTIEQLVAELRLIAEFYELVASRGYALLIGPIAEDDEEVEPLEK